jgi:hypothetical protein
LYDNGIDTPPDGAKGGADDDEDTVVADAKESKVDSRFSLRLLQ